MAINFPDSPSVSDNTTINGVRYTWNGTSWYSNPVLTAESNDLSAAVTWAIVPDAYISESSVTQHSAALNIPSALTDLSISDGTNGQVLTTNGSGSFSFTTVSSGASSLLDLTDVGADGTSGQVLTTDGAGSFTFTTVSSGGLSNVVEDTTPQLGGNLDTQGYKITAADNQVQDITIGPGSISGAGTQTGNDTFVIAGNVTSTDNGNVTPGKVYIEGGVSTTTGTITSDEVNIGTMAARTKRGVTIGHNTLTNGITIYAPNSSYASFVVNQGTNGGNVQTIKSHAGGGTSTLLLNASSLKIVNNFWPQADGTADQILKTNGSGVLSWTDLPTVPTTLTDLGISDGTNGQVLSTNGSGTFTFIDAASGGGATSLLDLTDVGADGTSGQVLTTDGAGSFTFTTVSSGGGSSATPTTEGVLYGYTNSSSTNLLYGYGAGGSITTGTYNVVMGDAAGDALTSATGNIAIGSNALTANTGSGSNVAIGRNALQNFDAASGNGNNFALGYNALQALTTGVENIGMGSSAGFSMTTGNYNTCIGRNAGYAITTAASTTAIGNGAVSSGNVGSTTGIGFNAGGSVTGNNGTYIGSNAGRLLTTGANNTFLGANAGNTTTTGSNNICVGRLSDTSSNSVNNEIVLGKSDHTALRCNVQTISALSDARDKTNVEDLTIGLDFVSHLRPVSFDWDRRDGTLEGKSDIGFIAQELQQAQEDTQQTVPGLVYDSNPEKLEAAYSTLVPVMIKAIQELNNEVAALKQEIEQLKNS